MRRKATKYFSWIPQDFGTHSNKTTEPYKLFTSFGFSWLISSSLRLSSTRTVHLLVSWVATDFYKFVGLTIESSQSFCPSGCMWEGDILNISTSFFWQFFFFFKKIEGPWLHCMSLHFYIFFEISLPVMGSVTGTCRYYQGYQEEGPEYRFSFYT